MTKNESGGGILSGAAYLTFSAILVKIIGVLYKVPMSYILSDEGMGYFNAAYTIYSVLYLLGTAGVPKAITVLVSGYNAQGKTEKSGRTYILASRIFFTFGFILCLILTICAKRLAAFLGSPNAVPAILMIAPSLIFVSLGGVYRGYLCAHNAFSVCAVASVMESVSKLLLGLVFLWIGRFFHFSLPWLCALSVLGISIGSVGAVIYLYINIKNNIPSQKTEQKCFVPGDKGILKSIFCIALPITLGGTATGISSLTDLSMIMRRLEFSGMNESEAAAVYGNYTTLSVPMLQMAISLITPIAVVILPMLAASAAKRERAEFSQALGFASEITACIAWPIALVFFFLPYQALALIFNSASASLAAPLLRLLAPALVIFSILLIANTALEGIGHPKLQMISMFIGIAVKIFASYALLSDVQLGIMGAPIGTALGYAASLIFSLACLSFKRVGCFSILKKQLLPFICASSAMILSVLLFQNRVFSYEPQRIFICLCLTVFCSLYFLFLYICGVLRVEKIKKLSKQPIFTN